MLARVRSLVALFLASLLACSAPKSAVTIGDAAPPSPKPSEAAPRIESAPDSAPSRPASLTRAVQTKVPAHGCVARAEHELGPAERAFVGYLSGARVVVALESSARTLALWMQTGDAPFVRRASLPLEASGLRGTLHCAQSCELALVDERARLLGFAVQGERLVARGVLASGLDRRFAPALTQQRERILYGYTSAVDEAMHTWLVVRSAGKTSPPRDLTPAGHGAAAASFVLGAARPTLVVIDARAGVSPLLEVEFDESAEPKPAAVRTPVSQPYAPPLLAAVQYSEGKVEVFYTVIGRAAMTAIGRVPLRTPVQPTPLAASKGYGELSFAAAVTSAGALLAIESPTATAPTAKRTLLLKLTDGANTYDALTIERGGEAARPSLVSASAGESLLAYVSHGVAYAVELACSP